VSPGGVSAVALEILGYLQQHPHASDTLVGIARWWLLRQRIETMTKTVKKALDELMSLGFVVSDEGRVKAAHEQPAYSVNPKRKRQIRLLLARAQSYKEPNAIG
jgi:hypothetical protein